MKNDPVSQTQQPAPIERTEQTTCCIVGGGPAGAMLALILAHQSIPVMLLEEHADFDRDFRGDTLHPSTMQIIDQLGLADRLLEIPHAEAHTLAFETADGPLVMADFRRLKTRFPYIAMLPQSKFLDFITSEAKRYPTFQLVMGARVEKLIEEDGYVHGVHYRGKDGWHEVRATLTVAADGRFSRLRKLAGFEPIKTAPPMDVLWFRLPVEEDDPKESSGLIRGGHFLIFLRRADCWQIGYIIPKGGYQKIHAAGMEVFRQDTAAVLPTYLGERVSSLQEWKQISVLAVESSRLARWYRPGLLLIGDAAHVMSPVGGVGINYAVQDAVVAANVLSVPLKKGQIRLRDLAEVQRQREWPTKTIQSFQNFLQRRVVSNAFNTSELLMLPLYIRILLKLPVVRDIPARLIAFGPKRVRLQKALMPDSSEHAT
jgi:2-polyprenyl-6-methoxyphenol hydroxylase-like FAD-dependent oxidoreductase